MSTVGSGTVSIGDQLETVDRQRSRAQDADTVIKAFLSFYKDDFDDLDRFVRGDVETKRQVGCSYPKLTATRWRCWVDGSMQ